MTKVVITSAVRTAIGGFQGSFTKVSAVELGKTAVAEAIKRSNIEPKDVNDVYLGCVLQAGQGQNVARQVSIGADIPDTTPAMTINIVCGSGLRSVSMAAQMIK